MKSLIRSVRSKRVIVIAFAVLVVIAFAGCSHARSSLEKIDVTGMTVSDARGMLAKEGWNTECWDDTPYSDYIPGDIENGDTTFGECVVTYAEFIDSKNVGNGYASIPKCIIHFESESQSMLEEAYDGTLYGWQDWYDDLRGDLERGEDPDSVAEYVWERCKEIHNYDDERVPLSRKQAHQQILDQYVALLNECGYQTPDQQNETNSLSDGVLDWSQATAHVGETVTIQGPVKSTKYASGSDGAPTFLDIGASYPDENRVTVTIWGEDRSGFSSAPEELYRGQTIQVTGEIYLYEGTCHIEVSSPTQISVL